MMTHAIVSPQQAALYFAQDNAHPTSEAQMNSRWQGQGAKQLGLHGTVEQAIFATLLHGRLENGIPLRQTHSFKSGVDRRERGGDDFTCSAPKSVSMRALWGDDDRLMAAHCSANDRAIAWLEKQVQARIWNGRKQTKQTTGNAIVASFDHTCSRELDPNLHTHNIFLNGTQTADGRWKALVNDAMVDLIMVAGLRYRQELAQGCHQLGYSVEWKDGLFEIAGYTGEQRQNFSKRRMQIVEAVGADASTAEKQIACILTRPKKPEERTLEELRQYWDAQNQKLGLAVVHPQPTRHRQVLPQDQNQGAKETLLDAIRHFDERAVTFSRKDLLKFGLSQQVQAFEVEELETAIEQAELIADQDGLYKSSVTRDREAQITELVHSGKETCAALNDQEWWQSLIAPMLVITHPDLTECQREAIGTVLTSHDRFMLWRGRANPGTTTALQQVCTYAEVSDYKVIAVASKATAAQQLGIEFNCESQAVSPLLHNQSSLTTDRPQLWIVGQMEQLTAEAARQLMNQAVEENARILFWETDRRSAKMRSQGLASQFQQYGMLTANLESSPQSAHPERSIKKAVALIAENQVQQGLKQLDQFGRVVEIQDDRQRQTQLVQDFLALPPEQHRKAVVIASTPQEQAVLTAQLRLALKQEGQMGETAMLRRLRVKDDPLEPKWLEVAVGDRLRYKRPDQHNGSQPYQEAQVADVTEEAVVVRYRNSRTRTLRCDQAHDIDHAWVHTFETCQEKTADRALVAVDASTTAESLGLALSRVKQDLQIYTPNKFELLGGFQETELQPELSLASPTSQPEHPSTSQSEPEPAIDRQPDDADSLQWQKILELERAHQQWAEREQRRKKQPEKANQQEPVVDQRIEPLEQPAALSSPSLPETQPESKQEPSNSHLPVQPLRSPQPPPRMPISETHCRYAEQIFPVAIAALSEHVNDPKFALESGQVGIQFNHYTALWDRQARQFDYYRNQDELCLFSAVADHNKDWTLTVHAPITSYDRDYHCPPQRQYTQERQM